MNSMENLNNIKKDLIYAIANRFKIYDEDIFISEFKINLENGKIEVDFYYKTSIYDNVCFKKLDDYFSFSEVWKKDNK